MKTWPQLTVKVNGLVVLDMDVLQLLCVETYSGRGRAALIAPGEGVLEVNDGVSMHPFPFQVPQPALDPDETET